MRVALAVVELVLCTARACPGHSVALARPVRADLSVDNTIGRHTSVLVNDLVAIAANASVVGASSVVPTHMSVGRDAAVGHTLALEVACSFRAVNDFILTDVALKAIVAVADTVWLAHSVVAAGHNPVLRLRCAREWNALVVVEDSARIAYAGNNPNAVANADSKAAALDGDAHMILAEAAWIDAVVAKENCTRLTFLAVGSREKGITDTGRNTVLDNARPKSAADLSVMHALIGGARRGDACVALLADACKAVRAVLAGAVVAANKAHAVCAVRWCASSVRQPVAIIAIAIIHHASSVTRADRPVEYARLWIALSVDLYFSLRARRAE